ncbi:MAG: phenylalanine 4-monooxygenase, partial [Bdellovibrionales bacterium]
MAQNLDDHLKKYIVDSEIRPYTYRDHAVWRFILRQLKSFLKSKAHPFYVEGLEKTGISVDEIPSIPAISEKLRSFGWSARPVSGFIPPAVFMEMQAAHILP